MKINEVYQGDCLEVMQSFPDNCIDTILTDPPYGLQFMGKNWDHGIPGPAYWRECLRVAKPGATLMAFGGTRTHHRLACAIEDAGWEIRDCITYFHDGNQAESALMASLDDEQLAAYLELHYPNHQISWVYGSGIGLGYDVSKGIDKGEGAEREVIKTEKFRDIRNGHGRGYGDGINASARDKPEYLEHPITAPATPLAAKFDGWKSRLKPAHEIIILAMAPLDGTYAENAEKWGVAGLNIDGGRIETNGESLAAHRNTARNDVYGKFNESYKPGDSGKFVQSQGRYPANVILDGSEEVEAEFAKAGVRTGGSFPNTQNTKSMMMQSQGKGLSPARELNDTGTASRYFQHCPTDTEPARLIYQAKAGPKERGNGNIHPCVKPLSLVRYLAKLTKTPDGGIVLDPFAGSGTTALACISEGRDYILIDKEADYAALCRRRIAEYTGQEIAPKEVEIAKGETTKQLSLW